MPDVNESPERLHELIVLRDLYENLLPPRQRQVMNLKFDEDLSLSEISERLGISRQACEDALKRGQRALMSYERKLGLLRRFREERRCISQVLSILRSMDTGTWEKARDCAIEYLVKLENGGERHGV